MKNHKTNLGHQKDHTTLEMFGDTKIEPLRKQKYLSINKNLILENNTSQLFILKNK